MFSILTNSMKFFLFVSIAAESKWSVDTIAKENAIISRLVINTKNAVRNVKDLTLVAINVCASVTNAKISCSLA